MRTQIGVRETSEMVLFTNCSSIGEPTREQAGSIPYIAETAKLRPRDAKSSTVDVKYG